MRISDWSSDVCSSDLVAALPGFRLTVCRPQRKRRAPMTFAIRNLDHVVVCVSDLERALKFYTEVLGCREERRVERIGLVQLRAGASLTDQIGSASCRERGSQYG